MLIPSFLEHDLHVHLYGCLTAEDLWQIAQTRHSIDWSSFEKAYLEATGDSIEMQPILSDPNGFIAFKKIYLFEHRGPFRQFQAKFNLIIALTDLRRPQEVACTVYQVAQRHFQEGLRHVEYRMLFPPWVEDSLLERIILAICKTLEQVEEESNGFFQGRFSLSLPRTDQGPILYEQLRDWMKRHPAIAKMTISIDFCFIEEGFPPKDKRGFIQKILQDNQEDSSHALAVLYHVGESFDDKSLESAIRWVHESGEIGAHRLGHAISLGINPKNYLGSLSREPVSERIDQIHYDLFHQVGLEKLGVTIDRIQLQQELELLWIQDLRGMIEKDYDDLRVQDLRKRQDYALSCLKKLPVCLEVCPTSNELIGHLISPEEHPIHRFLASGIPVILGSDDPGIFNTTLSKELYLIKNNYLIKNKFILDIIKNSKEFRSEKISGRMELT